MVSPLSSLGMFRKTKKKDWAYLGRRVRNKASINKDDGIDISQFISVVAEKTVKIKFNSKTGQYRFPNGRIISSGFNEAKLAARTMGYDSVKLGGLTIDIVK